jgi:small conductance mechanosensitive channel
MATTKTNVKLKNAPSVTIVAKKRPAAASLSGGMLVKKQQSIKFKSVGQTVYEERKEKKKKKSRFFLVVALSLAIVFIIFGFIAPILFKGTVVETFVNEYMLSFTRIFAFFENNINTIVNTLSVLCVYFIIITLILAVIRLAGHKGSQRRKTVVALTSSFAKYIGAIILLMSILSVWGVDTAALLTGLGALTLIVGLGAQSLIADVIAGLFIVFENNFSVDDFIIVDVDNFRGTVTEIGIRSTAIKSDGGDLKIINNSLLRSFINQSRHSSFASCEFTIECTENLDNVENIIKTHLKYLAARLPAAIDTPKYLGVSMFNASGLSLKIVARCDETNRLALNRDLNREVKALLDKNKISMSFPHLVIDQGAKISVKKTTKK